MRARLALAAAGIQVELREIVLRHKPEAMLQLSPKGTVPVLGLSHGQVIDESLDIMYWALQQSDPQQLLPAAESMPTMQALIHANDGPFKAGLDRYKYANRYPQEHGADTPEAFAQAQRDQAATHLHHLEHLLAQHSYVLGPQLSMADLAIAPFVRQYAHTDLEWFRSQDWPHLGQWLGHFLESPRFACIMHKYPPWEAGDTPVIFPPAL